MSSAMGGLLILYPKLSIAILHFVVGFTLLFRSFQLLGFAYDLKSVGILNWGNTAIISVLGFVFSFMLMFHPLFAGFSLVLLTAFSFIFIGLSSISHSIELKKLKDMPDEQFSELGNKIETIKKELNGLIVKK